MATNAELIQSMKEQLARPEEVRAADKSLRFRSNDEIIKGIQELQRLEAIETGKAGILSTFAKVNRAS